VVHELSWIPGVQTGGVLSVKAQRKGIDLWQKKPIPRNRFPLRPSLYANFSNFSPNKSFRGINRLCHTA
ncbi:hypothetical protein, partial [Kosakonia cowanii]|uniref:hypothetical protein n=1 Tax=Kosakonia cowanii TaxID=208223 RepID=UPI0028AC199D